MPSFATKDDQRYVSPVAALKIIESVLTSKSMSDDKSKDLIKVWSDFERIALSAEDITALQKTLNDAGKTNRAKMITALKRKPKTLLRWKEAQDIDALETEAKSIAKSNNPKRDIVLQTLYSIIAEKRLAEKVSFLPVFA
ncbi:unnamed protein product [Anisakis simplex]|uniref:DNA primase n=1 Tax=Anisakis simplex TaxID=6269 RepID=A0A0M3JFA3_ANISI|nr:unnamed protein product [Anisakis simplex]